MNKAAALLLHLAKNLREEKPTVGTIDSDPPGLHLETGCSFRINQ